MSNFSNSGAKVRLQVSAKNPSTEISITDAHFRPVKLPENAGHVEIELEPGIYRVEFREGRARWMKDAVLVPESGPVSIFQDSNIAFQSAAPLWYTETTHEWQQDPARHIANQIHLTRGNGRSGLMVFVRDIGEVQFEDPEVQDLPNTLFSDVKYRLQYRVAPQRRWASYGSMGPLDPTGGLSLVAESGDLIADLSLEGDRDPEARYGGISLECDVGTYRLRLKTGLGEVLEFPIVTIHGWQTQVFLLCRAYGKNQTNRRADLDSASISMVPVGAGFNPDDPTRRAEELALQALGEGRTLDGPPLRELLEGKFQNPMLGVYAAHLLLRSLSPNFRLLETVIGNLEYLVPDHPDVRALSIKLAGLTGVSWPISLQFDTPPMLNASWRAVVEASLDKPGIVPAGSLADRISDRLWGSKAWLVWKGFPDVAPLELIDVDLHTLLNQIDSALEHPDVYQWALENPILSPAERQVARIVRSSSSGKEQLGFPEPKIRARAEITEVGLAHQLGIPVVSVHRVVSGLRYKLGINSTWFDRGVPNLGMESY